MSEILPLGNLQRSHWGWRRLVSQPPPLEWSPKRLPVVPSSCTSLRHCQSRRRVPWTAMFSQTRSAQYCSWGRVSGYSQAWERFETYDGWPSRDVGSTTSPPSWTPKRTLTRSVQNQLVYKDLLVVVCSSGADSSLLVWACNGWIAGVSIAFSIFRAADQNALPKFTNPFPFVLAIQRSGKEGDSFFDNNEETRRVEELKKQNERIIQWTDKRLDVSFHICLPRVDAMIPLQTPPCYHYPTYNHRSRECWSTHRCNHAVGPIYTIIPACQPCLGAISAKDVDPKPTLLTRKDCARHERC